MISPLYRDRIIGAFASLLLHAGVLAGGGLLLEKPGEYGVEQGSGGIEVNLTAAPAELVSLEESTPAREVKPLEELSKDPEDIPLPNADTQEQKPPEPEAKRKEEPRQVQTAAESEHKGDGSSSIPGKDQTTFYSAGGAVTESTPNYLKNPAPPYPVEARQNSWQGIVVLKVLVSVSGYPIKVEIESSSGYAILDESAVKTVRKWRFEPARMGGIPIESLIRIPIRFELS